MFGSESESEIKIDQCKSHTIIKKHAAAREPENAANHRGARQRVWAVVDYALADPPLQGLVVMPFLRPITGF